MCPQHSTPLRDSIIISASSHHWRLSPSGFHKTTANLCGKHHHAQILQYGSRKQWPLQGTTATPKNETRPAAAAKRLSTASSYSNSTAFPGFWSSPQTDKVRSPAVVTQHDDTASLLVEQIAATELASACEVSSARPPVSSTDCVSAEESSTTGSAPLGVELAGACEVSSARPAVSGTDCVPAVVSRSAGDTLPVDQASETREGKARSAAVPAPGKGRKGKGRAAPKLITRDKALPGKQASETRAEGKAVSAVVPAAVKGRNGKGIAAVVPPSNIVTRRQAALQAHKDRLQRRR